jgi:4-hydroxybenzoate polyprenyltransferase
LDSSDSSDTSTTDTKTRTSFSVKALVKQLRPKQWAKNGIVLAPLLFSGNFKHPELILQAILCTVAFCAVSSATYTINDIADIQADKAHPTKCRRPLAAGLITVPQAIALVCLLMVFGLYCAFMVRPTIAVICLIYITMNLLYSFKLKNIPIVDILCIALGFVLRAVAGAASIFVSPSAWFLLCTTFGALFLALEKRRYELILLGSKQSEHRKVLQQYSPELIQRLESLIAPSLLATYSFYTFRANTGHGQWMMCTIPIVLYGVMRYQYLSVRGDGTGTPEDILWKDISIQLTLLVWVIVCALVIYGNPHAWLDYITHAIDSLR